MRVIDEKNIFFLNSFDITDREFYDFYREHRRYRPKAVNQYNYFVKTISGIMYVIHRMLAESQGGVYIEGWGYFACVKHPKKRRRKGSLTIRKNKYSPYFFPEKSLEDWTMSGTFEHITKTKIDGNNIEYKLHFDLCQSFRLASTFSKNSIRKRYFNPRYEI